MVYSLKITELANQELAEIVQYIAAELSNPDAASRLLDDVDRCYSNLLENPLMYEACRDDRLAKTGYRRAVIKNYVMVYRVDEREKIVYIMRFFYGKRDYEKII